MVTPLIPTAYLTLAEFADNYLPTKVSTRTVKRWLAANELPGATKDETGAWRIPAHARHTPSASTDVVTMTPAFQSAVPVQYEAPAALSEIPAGRTFYSAAEAAEIMSCPEMPVTAYTIKKHREYYHAVVVSNKIAVPRYRILQLKGLLPQ